MRAWPDSETRLQPWPHTTSTDRYDPMTVTEPETIEEFEPTLAAYMAGRVSTDPAHDMLHVQRVVNLARILCTEEGAHHAVVIPAAWLHDCITLPKDAPNKHEASTLAADEALRFLRSAGFPQRHLPAIHHAIRAHSYSGGIQPQTLEAKVVQDADRLDALGAIGIARCMLVGGALHKPLYHAEDPFCERRQPEDRQYVLDHFYQKLLKLPDSLHTASAREEARRRCQALQYFIDELRRDLVVTRMRRDRFQLL